MRGVSETPSAMTPLAGGHSGRTFVGEAGGERTVVRIYPPGDVRGPTAPEVDRAVLHLVRGLVPVPEVVELVREHPASGRPGLLVTSWMPGVRGDLVLPGLDAAGMGRLGRAMGTTAATLAGIPWLRPGSFVDAELTLGDLPGAGLPEWVESRLTRWDAPARARLTRLAERAQVVLDGVGRACLVHGDLNPKNVLVDPSTFSLTAVLDWEFAHAGHPWTDVGNLVRFERHPAYVSAVLDAWTALRGGDQRQLLDGARAADLWALVDLAARVGDNPVADRAERLLRAVADGGDLHAWPFAT
jgi:aminoglycoside phosphotransferase (APT) family kinase protein